MEHNAVVIRPICSEDAEAVNEIRRQPLSMRYTSALPTERREGTRKFIEGLGPGDHVFVAELAGRVVGLAGLHLRKGKQRHAAVLGIVVHDAAAGQGIGRTLMSAVLDLADHHLCLVRVELEVLVDNDRAIRLYEQCGFVHEGVKRKDTMRDGDYVDVAIMGRVRR